MTEHEILVRFTASIPARNEIVTREEKRVRYINEKTNWKTNGQRCSFCGAFLRQNRRGGYSCFDCSPEAEKVKLIKKIRKKCKLEVRIE